MAFDEHSARPRPGSPVAAAGDRATLNPSAMTVEQMARMLSVSAEVVRRHIQDGAPADFAGRMSLVGYAAWLNARLAQAGQQEESHGD